MSAQALMHDISPAWNEETIAKLLNKNLFQGSESSQGGASVQLSAGTLQVGIVKTSDGKFNARLQFASENERLEVTRAYQGLVVPLTHGYHYFIFDQPHDNAIPTRMPTKSDDDKHDHNANSDSTLSLPSPPLHLQLMALPSEELFRRTETLVGDKSGSMINDAVKSRRKGKKKRLTLLKHAGLASRLCHYFDGSRSIKQCSGIPVDDKYTRPLLRLLQSIPSVSANGVDVNDQFHWPISAKQRKGVQSENYLTLRQKHAEVWDDLWTACCNLLTHVYGSSQMPVYNALAITKNFRGSPHIDQHDKTFQHVIALGDFDGGYLCTEYDEETELQINVHHRLGRMDGRSVHWVSSWTGQERYSVVYYSTDAAHFTNPIPTREHVRFMQEFCRRVDAA